MERSTNAVAGITVAAFLCPKQTVTESERTFDMPKMNKKARDEMAFFIGANGRRQYNKLCMKCCHDCKQSFRATIVCCKKYTSKRKKCSDKVSF